MDLKRLFQALSLILALTYLLLNAKDRVILAPRSDADRPGDPYITFQVGVCISNPDEDTEAIFNGFTDALLDYGTVNNYAFDITRTSAVSEEESQLQYQKLIKNNSEVLFAIGKESLSSALIATSDIPIVMANIINYSNYLYTSPEGKVSRSFTGVSSLPNTEFLLSTMIEAAPQLNGVALIYSTEDKDSIYQNELLEEMLTSASIPWKEYEITARLPSTSSNAIVQNIITPRTPVAASSKEGYNLEVETIGKNTLLNGINEPESARAARISANWEKNKNRLSPEDMESEDTTESEEQNQLNSDTSQDTYDSDFHNIIDTAAKECDVIFIPKGSDLSDKANTITAIAFRNNAITVSNDISLGKNVLCTTYTDPYDQGYRAGRQAYYILTDSNSPEDISISETAWENSHKIYNGEYARILSLDFPKSFFELNYFLENHKEGGDTKRPTLTP